MKQQQVYQQVLFHIINHITQTIHLTIYMSNNKNNKNQDPPEWRQFKKVADKVSSYCGPCGHKLMQAYKLIKLQKYAQIKSQNGYITGLCTSNNEYPDFDGEVFVDDCFIYFHNTVDLIDKQSAYRSIAKNAQLKLECPLSKAIAYNPNDRHPIQLTDEFTAILPKLNYSGTIEIKFNTIDSIKQPHRLSEFPALRSNSGNSDFQLASLEMKTLDLRNDKGDRILADDPNACTIIKSNFSRIDPQMLKQMKVFQYDPVDQVFKQYGIPKINEEDQIIQYSAPIPTISYVGNGLKRLGEKIKKQAKRDLKTQLDRYLSQISFEPSEYDASSRWFNYDLQKNGIRIPKQAEEYHSTYFPPQLSKCFTQHDKSPYFHKFYEGNLIKKDIMYRGTIYKRFYFTNEDYLQQKISGLSAQTKSMVELLLQQYNHKVKLEMQIVQHKIQKIIELQQYLKQAMKVKQTSKMWEQQNQNKQKYDNKLRRKQFRLRVNEIQLYESIQYAFLNSMQMSQLEYNYWLKCYIFCAIYMRSLGPVYYSPSQVKLCKNISQVKSSKTLKQLQNLLSAANQYRITLANRTVRLNKEDIKYLYLCYESECKRRNAQIYNKILTQRLSQSKEIHKKLVEVQKEIESERKQVIESLQNLVAVQFKNYKQQLAPYVKQLILSLSVSNQQTSQAQFLGASHYGYLDPYKFNLEIYKTRQENELKIKKIIQESYGRNQLLQMNNQRQRKPQRGGGPKRESPMIAQLKGIAKTVKDFGSRNCNIDSIIRRIESATQGSNSIIKNELQSLSYQVSSIKEDKAKNQQTINTIQRMISKLEHQLQQDQKNKKSKKTASSDLSDTEQQTEEKEDKNKIIEAKEKQYEKIGKNIAAEKQAIKKIQAQFEDIQKKQKQLMKVIEGSADKLSAAQKAEFQKSKNQYNKQLKKIRMNKNQTKEKENKVKLDQFDINMKKLALSSIKGNLQNMSLKQLMQKIADLDKKQGKNQQQKFLNKINQKAFDALKTNKDLQKLKQQLCEQISISLKAIDENQKLNRIKSQIKSSVDGLIKQMKQIQDQVNNELSKTTPSDGKKQEVRSEAISYFTKQLTKEISKHEKQFKENSANTITNAINMIKKDDKMKKKIEDLLGL